MHRRDGRRPVRANRLDERYAAMIGVASGIVAVFAGAEPTGRTGIDHVIVAVAVAAVAWAAASASWWALSAAAGIAAVSAIDPVLTVLGGIAFVAGLWIGVQRRDLGVTRGLVAAVALNVLCRSELDGFFGDSAVIGISVGVALFVLGVRRRKRKVRRIAWGLAGAVMTLAILAVIGFGLTATRARVMLSDGQSLASQGIAQIGRGEFAEAAASFSSAGQAFSRASNELERPWAAPARLVPVVAQNADAVTDLAEAAGESSTTLASALSQIDPESLRLVDGRFDLAAIDAVATPLQEVQTALTELDGTVAETGSPWLLDPIQDRVDRLAGDIDDNATRLDNAVTAAELAPQMLGAGGPRRYLIIFTTPAEARGLGGFMGNFAEIEADGGRVTVTRFGRTGDLNIGGPDPTARVVTGPQDWLDQWGRYGFRIGPNGTTGVAAWSNVTMSPHFPSTAQVIAELYPQSGGQPLDGVFAMDPYVIAALLEFTGPVQIPATEQQLTAETAVDFLLYDQYAIDDSDDRVDLLEQVSQQTIERLLSGGLPNPTEVANALGGLAAQGRLVGWSADPDEQVLFESVNLSGSLPQLDGGDGIAVVVNNAAANKIDVYLERGVAYRATVDEATGVVASTLEVTLTNTAPAAGRPAVVIGNGIDEPSGTSRSLVSIYTALPVLSATRDGEPLTIETGMEQGWNTARIRATLPAGGSTTIVLSLAGQLEATSGYSLVTRPQALVLPEQHDLRVTSTQGNELVAIEGEATVARHRDADP